MKNNRKYSLRDVEMLLAAKTIINTLSANREELAIVRSNWTEEYVTNLTIKVDEAVNNYLGLDKKRELRETTNQIEALQEPAHRDLMLFKTQIEVDFPDEADFYYKRLGYKKHLKDVHRGNQEALIQLLYAFKNGIDQKLEQKVIDKGLNPELIHRIVGYGTELLNLNAKQEQYKESSKVLVSEAVDVFNEIYDEVIGICKIAYQYYYNDPVKQNGFSFAKISRNMGQARKEKTEEELIEEVIAPDTDTNLAIELPD